jgi:hypothetical protein
VGSLADDAGTPECDYTRGWLSGLARVGTPDGRFPGRHPPGRVSGGHRAARDQGQEPGSAGAQIDTRSAHPGEVLPAAHPACSAGSAPARELTRPLPADGWLIAREWAADPLLTCGESQLTINGLRSGCRGSNPRRPLGKLSTYVWTTAVCPGRPCAGTEPGEFLGWPNRIPVRGTESPQNVRQTRETMPAISLH